MKHLAEILKKVGALVFEGGGNLYWPKFSKNSVPYYMDSGMSMYTDFFRMLGTADDEVEARDARGGSDARGGQVRLSRKAREEREEHDLEAERRELATQQQQILQEQKKLDGVCMQCVCGHMCVCMCVCL